MEHWLEIACGTHGRDLASGYLQGFENPGCGQNEQPRRRYWAWEALDGLSCLTMIDVQEYKRFNDFLDSNMIRMS